MKGEDFIKKTKKNREKYGMTFASYKLLADI
jgi:hypothetical protein